MKYISTRSESPNMSFKEVVLEGLAKDGGLYVPEYIPLFSDIEIQKLKNLSYQDLTFKIIRSFVDRKTIDDKSLKEISIDSYKDFSHKAIAPLKQLSKDSYILELFHGPTLSFKDYALQLLGNILNHFIEQDSKKVVIIGATSGDTGSAAIAGCKINTNSDIFIFHPRDKISNIQRRQMTTVIDKNIHNIAIEGNFDDCQSIVKSLFLNKDFLPEHQFVAVNSINWTRIMAQIIYYFYSAINLGANSKNPVSFVVPTGNFGNIYAGYIAKKMGLPVNRLIISNNKNNILTRFVDNNDYSKKNLVSSLAPSMDIQVASNFERMLFDFHKQHKKSSEFKKIINNFLSSGKLKVDNKIISSIKEVFLSYSFDDNEIIQSIKKTYDDSKEVIDPHTATAVAAAQKYKMSDCNIGERVVILATAHSSKFQEIENKSNISIDIPDSISKLKDKKEKIKILPNNFQLVKNYIESCILSNKK